MTRAAPLEKEEDMAMNDATLVVDGCKTLPQLFLKNSTRRGSRIAMREKEYGIWQSYSWDDYREYAMAVILHTSI